MNKSLFKAKVVLGVGGGEERFSDTQGPSTSIPRNETKLESFSHPRPFAFKWVEFKWMALSVANPSATIERGKKERF